MKPWQYFYGSLLLSLILAVSSCSLRENTPAAGQAGQPVVTISNPKPGEQVQPGQEIKVQSTAIDPAGIARVELVVNGETIWVDANAQPQPNTPFIVAHP